MEALLHNFFNLGVYRAVFPFLLRGLWTTIWLSALVIPIGLAAGMALALAGFVTAAAGARLVAVYTDFFRAFPPLVLLILIYFGLPFLGLELPQLAAWRWASC
jgi:polar amino acid transport system permease protein